MADVDNGLERKAALLRVLAAAVYTVPDEALIEAALDEKGVLRRPPWPSSPSIAQGVELLDAVASSASSGCRVLLDELVADHFRLIEGAGVPLAPPWESLYGRGDGCLFGAQTMQVRALYGSCGLVIEGRGNEPDDHLGLELSFAAFLLGGLAAEAEGAGKTPERALYRETLRLLLEDHLLTWVDRWYSLVHEHAATGFFRAVACLVQGVVHGLGDDLGCGTSAPARVRALVVAG